MWPVWILGAIIGIGSIAAYLIEARRIPTKQARFQHRDALSLEEIYARYFGTSGITKERFESLWNTVATTLKLDPSRLRPTDRFDRHLSPVKGHLIEDELADLNDFYRQERKRMGIADNNQQPQTLDEFIRALGNPAP